MTETLIERSQNSLIFLSQFMTTSAPIAVYSLSQGYISPFSGKALLLRLHNWPVLGQDADTEGNQKSIIKQCAFSLLLYRLSEMRTTETILFFISCESIFVDEYKT